MATVRAPRPPRYGNFLGPPATPGVGGIRDHIAAGGQVIAQPLL